MFYVRTRKMWPFNTGDHMGRFDYIYMYIQIRISFNFRQNMLPRQGCMTNMLIIFLVVKGQNYNDVILTPDIPSCLFYIQNMKALWLKTNMFSQGQSCLINKKVDLVINGQGHCDLFFCHYSLWSTMPYLYIYIHIEYEDTGTCNDS